MRVKTHILLFIVTLTIFVLLLVQTLTSFIPMAPLNGIIVKTEMPVFTFSSYVNGTYQEQLEKYSRDNFGFREWLIPFYYQYEWDFFHKVERRDIFFGQDNWLYFGETVQDHYETLTYKHVDNVEDLIQEFQNDAMKIYYLQELLKEYGTTLFVCIVPSKNEIYPEYLPPNNIFYRQGGIHAEDWYAEKFQELGVNCLDLHSLFKSLKGKVSYPLFYKTSSHYSHIAATYAADTLVRFMEEISGLNIQNFKFGQVKTKKPKNIDRDLEGLFNLIRPIEKKAKYYYVDIEPIPDSTAVKPRWLTIGDSYYWSISEEIREAHIFDSSPFWYYCQEVNFDEGDRLVRNRNIANELIEADIVTLLWCPLNLYTLEHGIVNNALLSLCSVDNFCSNLTLYMKNTPEWYKSVMGKAKANNRSLEEQIQSDSIWVIQQTLDQYFNFEQFKLPSERNPRIASFGHLLKGKTPEEICMIKHSYRNLKKNRPDASEKTLMREAIQQLKEDKKTN